MILEPGFQRRNLSLKYNSFEVYTHPPEDRRKIVVIAKLGFATSGVVGILCQAA